MTFCQPQAVERVRITVQLRRLATATCGPAPVEGAAAQEAVSAPPQPHQTEA